MPDFLVETPTGIRFLLEVKAFEHETILRKTTARVFTLGHMALQKRVQRPVRDAAEQMRAYASERLPIVIALDNWRQVGLAQDQHSLGSLFGALRVVQTVDLSTARVVESRWEREDDNSPLFKGGNEHVSAVIAVISGERFDTLEEPDDFTRERPMKVRIMRNPFASVPLPAGVFVDPCDEEIAVGL